MKTLQRAIHWQIAKYSPATFILAYFFIMVSHYAYADNISVVTEEFPPYNYLVDGKITGLSTEVLQAVAKKAQTDIKISLYPSARAYRKALNSKNLLTYSLAKTPEREKLFHWVGEITPVNTCFFSLKNRKEIEIKQLSDAKNFRVITQRAGRIEKKLLKQGFNSNQNLLSASFSTSSLKLMLSKRANLWPFLNM